MSVLSASRVVLVSSVLRYALVSEVVAVDWFALFLGVVLGSRDGECRGSVSCKLTLSFEHLVHQQSIGHTCTP
jgi:hypothetical protein